VDQRDGDHRLAPADLEIRHAAGPLAGRGPKTKPEA
jgi:hypothetical protein